MQDVIYERTLAGITQGTRNGYLCHAYCHQGQCAFHFNGQEHVLAAGDCLIVRRGDLMHDLHESSDLAVEMVYATPQLITTATPQSNYGTRGTLSLFRNPIMHLTPEQRKVCTADFDYVRRRLACTEHKFYRDALVNAVQGMIIDFFDFHATLCGTNDTVTLPYAQLINRFLAMLERGDYRKHREVAYYADCCA